MGLSLIFVLLRLSIRLFLTRNANATDALIVLTFLFFLTTVICDTISYTKGLFAEDLTYNSDLVAAFQAHNNPDGTTTEDSLDDLVVILKILYASAFPYVSELWGLKICFLLLYGSLIPKSMTWLRRCLFATWMIVGIGYVTSMLMMGLWCLPVERNWDVSPKAVGKDRCFAYSSVPPYFTLTAFHVFTDIFIYILPFPLLKTLALSRSQHWGVISIFALGGICILCTIGRTVAIGLTANIAQVGLWTSLEQATGLVVVCVPALKALIWKGLSREGSRARSATLSGSRVLAGGDDERGYGFHDGKGGGGLQVPRGGYGDGRETASSGKTGGSYVQEEEDQVERRRALARRGDHDNGFEWFRMDTPVNNYYNDRNSNVVSNREQESREGWRSNTPGSMASKSEEGERKRYSSPYQTEDGSSVGAGLMVMPKETTHPEIQSNGGGLTVWSGNRRDERTESQLFDDHLDGLEGITRKVTLKKVKAKGVQDDVDVGRKFSVVEF